MRCICFNVQVGALTVEIAIPARLGYKVDMIDNQFPEYAKLEATFVAALSARLLAEDNGEVSLRHMSRCANARGQFEKVAPHGSEGYLQAVAKAFGAAGRSF
jgi:hypothetical protein